MSTATISRPRTRRQLREHVTGTGRVDRANQVIKGVKILGTESKNGRSYTPECLRKAAGLYENAKVLCNHDHTDSDRAIGDVFGRLKNVTLRGDGLYGDLHFLKSHPMSERVIEAAERDPSLFGLSHVADGDGRNVGGKFVVEEIHEVFSVDLVSSPATTAGLFESVGSGNSYAQALGRWREDDDPMERHLQLEESNRQFRQRRILREDEHVAGDPGSSTKDESIEVFWQRVDEIRDNGDLDFPGLISEFESLLSQLTDAALNGGEMPIAPVSATESFRRQSDVGSYPDSYQERVAQWSR